MTDKVNIKVDVVTPLKETFEQKSKKKTSWSSTVSDDNYPSEKLVKDTLDTKEASGNKVSSWSGTTNNTHYPSEKLVKDSLDGKVDKVNGKGLSSNDYTNEAKAKVDAITYSDGIAYLTGAYQGVGVNTTDGFATYGTTEYNASYRPDSDEAHYSDWDNEIVNKSFLSSALQNNVDYSNITNTPTNLSDFTNDGDGSNPFVTTDDIRLSDDRTPTSHTHGQITNDGKITSTAVSVASGDNILITDASDSSKVKRVANLLTDHIQDGTAHSHIGSSANDTQSSINSSIDTALSNKADSSSLSNYVLTSKILDDIDNATDNTQVIGALELKTVLSEIEAGVPVGVELTANKKSSWSSTTTDTNYPSEKLVKDSLDAKMDDTQLVTSISNVSDDSHVPSAKAVYDYVASVPKWTTQVANTIANLPESGSVGVFYLVPNSSSESQNAYDEYFWNGSSYEKFGTKTIDISNLVTLDDVLTYINNNGSLSLPTTGNDAGYLVFTVS